MIQKKNNYVYGSLAEKIEYDIYEQNKVLKEKKKYKSNIVIKLKMTAYIGFLFLLGFIVIYRYAQITDINYKISRLEMKYENLRNENSRLKVAIENETNLPRIMEIAQNELGMQKPDKYQILHIRVPKTNYTVTSEVYKNSKTKDNFFAELIQKSGTIKRVFN